VAWLLIACSLAGWSLWQVEDRYFRPSSPGASALAQEQPAPAIAPREPGDADAVKQAFHFVVSLPITDEVERRVRQRVEQALRKIGESPQRPVFVFELRGADQGAEESTYGAASQLARFLSGERLARVRTVAWLPQRVKGHAVLVVLACEQIVMGDKAELGAAGIAEKEGIDETLRRTYAAMAESRRTLPVAVALGMLDEALEVYAVALVGNKGTRFETADQLERLRQEGAVARADTLFAAHQEHVLDAATMRKYGFATHLANSRRALADQLRIPRSAWQDDLLPEGGWRPVRIDLHGPIHREGINRLLRTLDDTLRTRPADFLVLVIESAGGDLGQSHRLAERLAELAASVHTVAYVRQARGDAALIALSCRELVMHPQARLGGPGERNLAVADLDALRPRLVELFHKQGRDWSLPIALLDPRVHVQRYRDGTSGEVRYLCVEEFQTLEGDVGRWQAQGNPLHLAEGLTAAEAEELGLSAGQAADFSQFAQKYHLSKALEPERANWALEFIEWLADPRIAGALLFVGGFALLFELSTPGLGLPGFVSLVCFLLFFWSQFLHGTAGWLEVLLFVGGLACLAIELFALPGFGVFGLGGIAMIVASIVLASQTFVIPSNPYQLRQFPISLAILAAGMAGGVVSVAVLRRLLPQTPFVNQMLLEPPEAAQSEDRTRREALVVWDHLLGQRGVAISPLVPAGKVRFGDQIVDCVSNGELIAKGTQVEVEEVTGSRVVVRRVETA
jgi:membrane-bound ClpP family serine protease